MFLHQSGDSLQAALPCNSIPFTSSDGRFQVGQLSLAATVAFECARSTNYTLGVVCIKDLKYGGGRVTHWRTGI